jgi:hypothetical protein
MGKPTILRFERNCWMENCRTPMDCTPKCRAFLYHWNQLKSFFRKWRMQQNRLVTNNWFRWNQLEQSAKVVWTWRTMMYYAPFYPLVDHHVPTKMVMVDKFNQINGHFRYLNWRYCTIAMFGGISQYIDLTEIDRKISKIGRARSVPCGLCELR